MEVRLQVLIDTNANQQFIVNVSWQMGFNAVHTQCRRLV